MALLFSAANVFFRDVSNVASIMTNFVRFSVPMIYPYTMVEDKFGAAAQYYLYNPIADAVLLFQRAFWVGTTETRRRRSTSTCRPTSTPTRAGGRWSAWWRW